MQLLPHFIASFFYSHNLIFGVPSRINFVAWSLEVEVQFYLLAPTLALLFLIKRQTLRRALLVGLIITFGAIAVLTASKDIYKISLLGNAQYFLAGFLFADIYLSGKTPQSRRFSWDLIFVLSGTLLLFTFNRRRHPRLVVRPLASLGISGRILSRNRNQPPRHEYLDNHHRRNVLHHLSPPQLLNCLLRNDHRIVAHNRSLPCSLSLPNRPRRTNGFGSFRNLVSPHRTSLHAPRLAATLRKKDPRFITGDRCAGAR